MINKKKKAIYIINKTLANDNSIIKSIGIRKCLVGGAAWPRSRPWFVPRLDVLIGRLFLTLFQHRPEQVAGGLARFPVGAAVNSSGVSYDPAVGTRI